MNTVYTKYAELLTNYCLEVRRGEKVYVKSTYLAEPLLQELQIAILKAGGHPYFQVEFEGSANSFFDHADDHHLDHADALLTKVMDEFDCYLVVRAPFNLRSTNNVDGAKRAALSKANKSLFDVYKRRTATGEMRRSLCQFPTQASAQEAGMSLKEYQNFVFGACNLFSDDPQAQWLKRRAEQQSIVDYLNNSAEIRYKGKGTDITFSVAGRTWINSDGRTNMPSGEVFSGPVEDSVNGVVTFSYPALYMGHEVQGVRLEVKNGEVVHATADQGQDFLREILAIDGAKFFGEVAIGTNYEIKQFTKNILFDEKIGGTIHMALGQSYSITGGTNESTIHWDMIADMTDGGEIFADGKSIYKNGIFLI